MSRGLLTPEIIAAAERYLGIEDFTVQQLRLLPYLIDCSLNCRQPNARHLRQEEQDILSTWKDTGLLETAPLKLSKEFWDGALHILWLGYANK